MQVKTFLNSLESQCKAYDTLQDVLAACDNSQDKKLTIWNTTDGQMVAQTYVSFSEICLNLIYTNSTK